jgi:hypothetical protein
VLLAVVENGTCPKRRKTTMSRNRRLKTHLGRIFTKTDTKRQSELVKLVAAFRFAGPALNEAVSRPRAGKRSVAHREGPKAERPPTE